jgi:UDP:flavonoid glycosyltransferase YjiC (YdhE family)
MGRVGEECDVAVTNATFGATCGLLLAGKPVFMIPNNLERIMGARRVVQLGAGIAVHSERPHEFADRLNALFTNERYRNKAQGFAARYQHLNLAWQTEQMVAGVEEALLA